jgi:hypothetical protein
MFVRQLKYENPNLVSESGCKRVNVYCPNDELSECLVSENRGLPVLVTCKVKAVPLTAMEALGGRGRRAPTHSRPRH